MLSQLRCRPRLFGGELNRQLRLSKNENFQDDLYDKTENQFLNKSTNMESKEREIEREIEKTGDEEAKFGVKESTD